MKPDDQVEAYFYVVSQFNQAPPSGKKHLMNTKIPLLYQEVTLPYIKRRLDTLMNKYQAA